MNLAALSDRTGYQLWQRDQWQLLVDARIWKESWWPQLRDHMAAGHSLAHRSLHAWSFPVELPVDGGASLCAYLKLYHGARLSASLKDRFRPAKPVRAFLASRDLRDDGFRCPRVIALGANRADGNRPSALFLTRALPWPNLRQFALGLGEMPYGERMRGKRELTAALGRTVAALHTHGYVHGDLVTTNVLVDPRDQTAFAFIDHDRTVRAGRIWRGPRQMRNLIQLNRHEFPDVTHTDRLRFFQAYARASGWSRGRTESTARKLARRTIRRRRETVT